MEFPRDPTASCPAATFAMVNPAGLPVTLTVARNTTGGVLELVDGQVVLRPDAKAKGWRFAEEVST